MTKSKILYSLYKKILRIRLIEEEIAKKYSDQKMRCPVHLSIGQESIPVSICSNLKKTDIIVTAHRSHAHYLAKGGDLNKMIAELYGKETIVPWGVIFKKIDNIPRHPSQIYEAALEGILLFIILNILVKVNLLIKRGFISSIFLILYSVFRFFIEFFREPDPQLGYLFFSLSMGQILSLLFFSTGIIILLKNEK